MKKLYWQAHNLPRLIMIVFCLFVLGGLFSVEYFKQDKPQAYYQEKLKAASLAYKAFKVVKAARKDAGYHTDAVLDPQRSGLIGQQFTSITSDAGALYAKQTTINPNIAALFVEWLMKLGLKKGDVVAVGMTGSFPAIDINMLAAIKALELKPLIIFSAAASQYGANLPKFSWLDMYAALTKTKVFDYPILGASLGGKRDNAYGMNQEGHETLMKTIERHKYHFIDSTSTKDGVNKRMALYREAAQGRDIETYINVGGGAASIGLTRLSRNKKTPHPHSIPTGVIKRLPVELANTDSVAVRFLKEGVPLINLHNVGKFLIEKYGFPPAPRHEPLIGTGGLFMHQEYNTWLAIAVLVLDIAVFVLIALISKKYVIRYKR